MSQGPSVKDAVDPVDRYIGRLYRGSLQLKAGEYRAWALNEWRQVVPHDAALWGSGSLPGWKFHSVTVTDLPESFPRTLEETRSLNPIAPVIIANLDTPVDMQSVVSDRKFFVSPLYERVFAPVGISRILSTAHLDRRSGLYSLVTLYRRDRKKVWTDEDRSRQKRITYHLYNAASHAFFLHLLRTRERPRDSCAAVVDKQGLFHQAQPRFLDLLEQHLPVRPGQALPFALPAVGEHLIIADGRLCLRADLVEENLFILWLWPAGPLDKLTRREREIVLAVAHGLSFKQAARKIGVAPSTVANHLYRVYRKLGVYSRTELAGLVYPEG